MTLSEKFEAAINSEKLKYKALDTTVFRINMADKSHLPGIVGNTFFINNESNEISVRAILCKNKVLKPIEEIHKFITYWNSEFKVPKLYYNETEKIMEMEWHWFFYTFQPSEQNIRQSVMDLFFDCSYKCLKKMVRHGIYPKPASEK